MHIVGWEMEGGLSPFRSRLDLLAPRVHERLEHLFWRT